MKSIVTFAFTFVCLSTFGLYPSFGQSVAERAASLKEWRTQCGDPDPDLQVAYVEAALATKDVAIQRICLRQTLQSDHANVVNLGLRAAIASMSQISLAVKIPVKLQAAITEADEDEDKLNNIGRWDIYRLYSIVQSGLIFTVSKASINSNVLTLQPLVDLTKPEKDYSGVATIIGTKLAWQGRTRIAHNNRSCRLSMSIVGDGQLQGEFQCEDWWPIPVTAMLM